MPNAPTDLHPNDQALIEAVRKGVSWQPKPERPDPEQLANPTFLATMPTIQATTIRALCLGLWDDVIADPKGVQVVGARIVGKLDLSYGRGQGPLALLHCHFAEELVVRRTHLPELNLSGSHLAKGLKGDGVHIASGLFCRNGFTSKGEIRLVCAQIGANAEFTKAKLNGGAGAVQQDGTVVTLQNGMDVTLEDGTVAILNHGPVARRNDGKTVSLKLGTKITLQDGTIATINGKTVAALSAHGMVVAGNLFCREGFESKGNLSLPAVKIGGLLDWRPTKSVGKLNLSHTTVGLWGDDWEIEKKKEGEKEEKPTLNLNHFTYGAFLDGGTTKTDSATRIAWIEASQGDDFKPGPYRTLARVLRAAGDDRGAKNVGHAMEKARAKHLAKNSYWPLNWLYRLRSGFFDVAIGHGYKPWRGAVWLLYLQIIGTIAFGFNAPSIHSCPALTCCPNTGGPGIIKPADPVFITTNLMHNPQTSSPPDHDIAYTLPPEYTPFNAFWYSFDTLIPLIDLGQEKAWSPSPLTTKISDDIPGWALLFYLYFHIIMGWVLSTLTVVALTGLIKRDPEGEE